MSSRSNGPLAVALVSALAISACGNGMVTGIDAGHDASDALNRSDAHDTATAPDLGVDATPDGAPTDVPPPPPDAPSDSGPANPCAGLMGLVCGSRIGMNPDTLYSCANGALSTVASCHGACVEYSDGNGDACPCPSGDGLYCGQTLGADSNTLYQCTGGRLTVTSHCGNGCMVNPPGVADACAPCSSGNGAYCGSEVHADPNVLYNCMGGVITATQMCGSSGCHVAPPGTPDSCNACPSGNGAYCGGPVGLDPNTLYNCNNGVFTVTQHCPTVCHVAPPGTPDYCDGSGMVSCHAVQWWNSALTYGPYMLRNGAYTWWDTDLAISSHTPIQLRHDSQLVADPVEAWGWQPQFIDMVTGQRFQFLHMQPTAQYTNIIGHVYAAGTIVGLSGGDSGATGYPTYSTGSHLCVETIAAYRTAFPAGTDPCR